MSSTRPALAMVAVVGVLGGLALVQAAGPPPRPAPAAPARPPVMVAQKAAQLRAVPAPALGGAIVMPAQGDDKDATSEGVSLPTDRRARQSLDAARDLMKDGDWGAAVGILQALLERKEDLFVEAPAKDSGGKDAPRWVSIREEANRLLGGMPEPGRQIYELRFGAKARAILARAKSAGDPQLLAEVALRYRLTDAGALATDLLGTYHLDRGDHVTAARCFQRLLDRPGAKPSAALLFKAALALRRSGDASAADGVWGRLVRVTGPEGVRLGERAYPLEQLRQELERLVVAISGSAADWRVPRGDAGRSARSAGGTPYLDDVRWMDETPRQPESLQWVTQAATTQAGRHQAVIPAYLPLATTVTTDNGPIPLLIYRSYLQVCAVDLRTGQVVWQALKLDGSLDGIMEDASRLSLVRGWLDHYLRGGCSALYENSTLGTLSADDAHVYAVDDLALPPHPAYLQQFAWGAPPSFGTLQEMVNHNSLYAYELDTGKIAWTVGGKDDKGELGDSFFLGAPLPLGGKLYVINEKKSELRLLCLDPLKKGALVWSQTLANPHDGGLTQDVARRFQAAPLAYGEGILVCPTNAGTVVAVDLLAHSLLWAHSYRQTPPGAGEINPMARRGGVIMMNPLMNQQLTPDWRAATPVVQDGRVVFTAPDGGTVQCLSLRDGALLWSAPRNPDDVYLGGVYGGKVLVVGRTSCRALALADGKPLWRAETGMPSGLGVATPDTYYLPLRAAGPAREPEVCAIDLHTGQVRGHARSRKKADGKMEIPGNLLFYEGDVVSQTVDAIKVYPQVDKKLTQIDQRLARNPDDPIGLTERGEMKLDKGQAREAVADLRRALTHRPPPAYLPKTRLKLYEALTELLQLDFAANEKYLDEYRGLCQVDVPADALPEETQKLQDEERRRKSGYYCLLAKGRERQARLLEAFEAYQEFGTLQGTRQLVPSVDEPAVHARPDVWARARIGAMMARATPAQRKPLEDRVAAEWQKVSHHTDPEAVARFVAVFGPLSATGHEAQLRLAELYIDKGFLLEAEAQLLPLRHEGDPALAARAVEALARLAARKDLKEDAAYFYRLLGTEYAGVTVRDGKTGSDLFNEMAVDKRFLPYLDEPPRPWAGVRLKAKPLHGSLHQFQQTVVLEPEGEVLPFFQQNTLAVTINANQPQLLVIDRVTHEPRGQPLPIDPGITLVLQQFAWGMPGPSVRFPYRVEGHLAIINLGPVVYGIDPVERRLLWKKDLAGGFSQPSQVVSENGRLWAIYAENLRLEVGRAGLVSPSCVCLQTRQGLVAVDPLTGRELWARADAGVQSQIFGDDRHIFVAETRDGSAPPGFTRALRAQDGASIPITDFGGAYAKHVRVVRGDLLVADGEAEGDLVLRLYDVRAGKDRWRKEFTAKARIIRTEDSDLTGVIEPANKGKVTVLDLKTGKELFVTRVLLKDIRDLEKATDETQGLYLLQDADLIYLVCNAPPEPLQNPWNQPPMSNFQAGLRSLPVNGNVYAFERGSGKLRWRNEVKGEVMLLDQFRDVPVLLFSARAQRVMRPANQGFVQQSTLTQAIDKRTGKLLWYKEEPNTSQYIALHVDPRARMVELVSYNVKLQFFPEDAEPKK